MTSQPDPAETARQELAAMREEAKTRRERREIERDERRQEVEDERLEAEAEARKLEAERQRMMTMIQSQQMLATLQPPQGGGDVNVLSTLGSLIATLADTSFGKNTELMTMLMDRLKTDLDEAKTKAQSPQAPAPSAGVMILVEQFKALRELTEFIRPQAPEQPQGLGLETQLRLKDFDMKLEQWKEENRRWWAEFNERKEQAARDAKTADSRIGLLVNQLVPALGQAASDVAARRMGSVDGHAGPDQPTPRSAAVASASSTMREPPDAVAVPCTQDGCGGMVIFRDPASVMPCPECGTLHKLTTEEAKSGA